ncbi:MAG: VOC family protein [Candidatus Binatia bacterium]|jgi:catechol 2,3-dioxygenase-like lactoylglutathione lyase family enzyme
MNQLRHLAIRTEEPEKLAAFYMEAFGFREVKEGYPPVVGNEKRTFHLTDGYFELAILANRPNQSPNGLYHFGVKVDDMDETVRRLESFQKNVKRRPDDTSFAELRVSDIDGNLIDLSVNGFLEYQSMKKGKGGE